MKINIQIKSVFGSVLFELEKENNTITETLKEAIKEGANLRDADLGGANLGGANLRYANLRYANLRYANLRGADLGGANLRDANLRDADLGGADLGGANLRDANLRYANLRYANLRYADLGGANLRGANLRDADLGGADLGGANLRDADLGGADLGGANLLPIKADFFEVLIHAIPEVEGLKQALLSGKVDGSTYQGECCCLVGTLANVRSCGYTSLQGIHPDPNRPIERFFTGIKPGDIPETNAFSKIAIEWIEEFQSYVAPSPASL